MKKIFTTFIIILLLIIASPKKVFAVCGSTDTSGGSNICYDSNHDLLSSFTVCTENTAVCCSTSDECENFLNIIDGPKNDYFDSINPLKTNGTPEISAVLSTPGGIVSRLLLFLFPLAGLILFVMLVWGGFEILSKSTQGTKGIEAGKNRITAAIIGFLLLFTTYWMAQIIEVIFGIVIV